MIHVRRLAAGGVGLVNVVRVTSGAKVPSILDGHLQAQFLRVPASMTRCTTFINSFGHQSLVIPAECPIDEIPAPFRSLIPGPYFDCMKCSQPFLLRLADHCGNDVIARWLTVLAEVPTGLVVHHHRRERMREHLRERQTRYSREILGKSDLIPPSPCQQKKRSRI